MHARAEEFVTEATERYDLDPTVQEFPEGTKTAADAAAAIGCPVGAIVSSLVFVVDGEPVVALTSGANRVDESRLADHFGVDPDAVAMADADTVREVTGWAIGGVPPICHTAENPTLMDPALLDYDTVWAAAGTPTTVFEVDPERLRELAEATVADVTA
ncbi:YbaK/EbsC family protein [Halobium salinum]|uniref:YbaK/EbsC family protein n=1 Tax=Halobium salinum TaxID=1364940 RepID=A0ABD5PHJ9_9EURY|nr:YbaK/EbsC family protein [Halobium salinum]